MLIRPTPDRTEAIERDDLTFEYFLETFVAREFLDGYLQSTEGAAASEVQRCERLIRYAQTDA